MFVNSYGVMKVIQGDGSIPVWRSAYFAEPVSYPSNYTAWWDQGEETYYKYNQAVMSFTTAGPGSTESARAGWQVLFRPNGDIIDESLNLQD